MNVYLSAHQIEAPYKLVINVETSDTTAKTTAATSTSTPSKVEDFAAKTFSEITQDTKTEASKKDDSIIAIVLPHSKLPPLSKTATCHEVTKYYFCRIFELAYSPQLNKTEQLPFFDLLHSVNLFRYFYTLLDSKKIDFQNLNGGCFSIAALNILLDLNRTAYIHFLPNSANKLLEQVSKELSFAIEIDETCAGIGIHDAKVLHSLQEKIFKAIKDLPFIDENIKSHVIIPGGYILQNEGHHVLYQVERAENDSSTFNFTVINTGEGTSIHTKTDGTRFCHEIIYKNVTLEQIIAGLPLENITSAYKDIVASTRMKDIFKIFDTYFLDENQTNKVLGKELTVQNQGSCSITSLLDYLKYRLGPNLYASYRESSLKRLLTNIPKELERFREDEIWQLLIFGKREKIEAIDALFNNMLSEMEGQLKALSH